MSTVDDVLREAAECCERSNLNRIEALDFEAMLLKLTQLRTMRSVEGNDIVRTALGLAIDEILQEMDRRNCLMLERRMTKAVQSDGRTTQRGPGQP